ncbi:hypothetical protein [Leptospira idonii]|uniref:Lipoprotein n=1 Tax=Leptospira idonii TaxID=1193500 RepID=A0A4R9LW50_9LEPT|nr:hypothetical protein [Leptospira idonii]TGN17293.1 hypothetical protein EHS15_17290 [Leptospira idonii]
MRLTRLILTLVTLFTFSSCEDQSKYDDKYGEVLLLQLALSQPSATASCATAAKKQEDCFVILAASQGTTQTVTSQSAKETQCTAIRQTSGFSKMSERGQSCVFDCQTTDWTIKIDTNECKTSTSQNLLISSANNAKVTACIRSCFQATNNQVSDSEILNLLLFNLIQKGE